MAGYGVDRDRDRRYQSYTKQPMTSSETARGNQSSFIQGRTSRRSRPSDFDDKRTSTVSTSNTSYDRLRGRDSSSHMSDQRFNYPSEKKIGRTSKRSEETTDRSREQPYSFSQRRNDNFSDTTSKSNTSYRMGGDTSRVADYSDHRFNYSSDSNHRATGPPSKTSAETVDRFHNSSSRSREQPYSYPHKKNDDFIDTTSKSNTSYGMRDSSHISDRYNQGFNYSSDRASETLSTRSAETADRFYDYLSTLRQLPISCPSQNKNENDPASMSNMSHSMPQDVPTLFSGGSNNMAELSRMSPSFRSSNTYSTHENFPSFSTEFSKSYPNQRDNNVRDTTSLPETYYNWPEDSSLFYSENYRKMVEYLGMPSKSSSHMIKNNHNFPSMPKESPVYQLDQNFSGTSTTENDHDLSLTGTKKFRTTLRNTSATTSNSWYPPPPMEFQMPHSSSAAPVESPAPHLSPPKEFPTPHRFQKSRDLSYTVSKSKTSRFIGESSSLLPAEDDRDFSAPNNTRTDFRMTSSSGETTGFRQNLSSATREFPKPSVFQRHDDYIFTVPSSNTPYGALKDSTVISTENFPQDGKTEQELDLELHAFQQLACDLRRLETSETEKSRLNSAAARHGFRIELNNQNTTNGYKCHLFIHGIYVASGIAYSRIKDSTKSAFKAALHKLQMPYLRIIQTNPNSKELQASKEPFVTTSPGPSELPSNIPHFLTNRESRGQIGSQYQEHSRESSDKKRKSGSAPLDKFIIFVPLDGMSEPSATRILTLSADLNKMLLKNEFFFDAERVRCVLKIENETLADEIGMTKTIARDSASFKALMKLRESCWLIKKKPFSESNFRATSKFLTREEFGPRSSLSKTTVTKQFHFKLKSVLENFVSGHSHEELLFNSTFSKKERLFIHNMCSKMGLESKSMIPSGTKIVIGVKKSLQKVFEHLKVVGGESVRYKLIPPGKDVYFQSSSSGSYIDKEKISQSQPEDAYHPESLVFPSGPDSLRNTSSSFMASDFPHYDSSHGKIQPFMGEQFGVGMPTAYPEASYYDDRTEPPFEYQISKDIPSFNRMKLPPDSGVPSRSKYVSPSKKRPFDTGVPSRSKYVSPSKIGPFDTGVPSRSKDISPSKKRPLYTGVPSRSKYISPSKKRPLDTGVPSRSKYVSPSKKRPLYTGVPSGSKYISPSRNAEIELLPITSTPGKSTSLSERKAEEAWKTEKDPHLLPIRRLALSTYSFTGNRIFDLKKMAKTFNIDLQERNKRFNGPKRFQCSILLNNIVVASGPLLRSKKKASKKAYQVAMENVCKPDLHLVKQQETNQFVLVVPSDEQAVNNLSKQSSPDYLEEVEENLHCPVSSGLAQFLKRMVILDTLNAKTSRQKLNETAMFNSSYVQFVKSKDNVSWDVKIGNKVVATASGKDGGEAAKSKACDIALGTMKNLCWCIKEKPVYSYNIDKVISASDFSMKYNTKGKYKSRPPGKGMTALELFLADYSSSTSREDLFFLDNFPVKARNVILRKGRSNRKLTCRRCRIGQERYLIVGKKLQKVPLLKQLKASGGETDKYIITPPTQEPDADINSIIKGATLGVSKNKDVTNAPNVDSMKTSGTCTVQENKGVEEISESGYSVDSMINDDCSDLVAAAASLSPHVGGYIEDSHTFKAASLSPHAGGCIEDSRTFKDKEENKKQGTEKGKKEVDHGIIGFDPGFIS